MNSTKWYKNPEMIVALSALLIGLVTAFTSIYSAYVDRAYSRASVWPRIEISRNFGAETFGYNVTNSGTGPAMINYAKVNYDSTFIKSWSDIDVFDKVIQSHVGNRILSSQQTIQPLVYQGDKVKDILIADEMIGIELCYCSIYDECWVIDRENRPKPVEYCEAKTEELFLQ
ncbi:conserved hypothetical protein [Shewanella denitrificans OS217]|jgi:hypothetical protein|uniref:Uncharacterized protein n=1 Tax=Shewanella denitrificans (strain OS217 / ATCC BAA-1090 / DSM 15013) TaxID=318161 RepID=Q12R59_SHEDO|nr:hypothetical protein [Shewanella denitrificans]ABE54067.1 conserved hypothetical protein [Shewanella denitrificans OS217]